MMNARLHSLAPYIAPLVATWLCLVAAVAQTDPDGAVFLVMADGLRHAALPYVDLWDHKPPLIYLSLVPLNDLPSWAAIAALWVAIVFGGTLALMSLLARHWQTPPLVAAIACLALPALTPMVGVFTEPLAALLGLLAFALVIIPRRPSAAQAWAAGIALGWAIMAKPTALFYVPGLLLLSLYVLRLRTGWLLIGAAVPATAIFGAYALTGHFAAAWGAIVAQNAIGPYDAVYSDFIALWILRFEAPQWAPLTILAIVLWRTGKLRIAVLNPSSLALIYSISLSATVVFKRTDDGHYLSGWLPLELALICLWAGYLSPPGRHLVAKTVAVLLLLASAPFLGNLAHWLPDTNVSDRLRRTANEIEPHLRPTDRLLILPMDPLMYWLVDRRPAYKYFWWSSATNAHFANLSDALTTNAVSVVLVDDAQVGQASWLPRQTRLREDLAIAGYQPSATMGHLTIWRRG